MKLKIDQYRVYILFTLSICFTVQASFAQSASSIDFNKGWKFYLGNDSLASQRSYDDSKWRALSLPHDWSIEGSFNEKEPATTQGGALPTGIGWYRKTFTLPKSAKKKIVNIEFDGVYRNSEVWINGHWLGKRPYGYSTFQYDLTPYLRIAGANVIAVKVDNSQQPNSRWYSGSGIYRNTRLLIKDSISIVPYGFFITTPVIEDKKAIANYQFTINNPHSKPVAAEIMLWLFEHSTPRIRDSIREKVTLQPGNNTFNRKVEIAYPRLWSLANPFLYQAQVNVKVKGHIVDYERAVFGVRSFHFDVNKGFFLNNKSLKIHGVCNHHDLGALGAAVNVRAMERQLEILKAMGVNAIRTAHNPPAPELLDLCDRMGFLVMDEAFDMWRKKKNKFDYFSDFDQWHKQDLEAMVLRDRNHPSVFIWSIGNEIREQFDSTGITITRELVDIIKAIDTTRPVTAALSEWNPNKNFMYRSGALDIIGLNYHHEVYDSFQYHYPGKVFIGAENMSAFATRGHYSMPSDSPYFWPARSPQKIVEHGNPDFTVSAYDQVSAYWGSTHETTWKIIKKHAFLSGLFVWSGFDFLGEPIPYPWPARSSYYGIIDLAGFPKDVYYMYQSEWTTTPVLHIFPHWNWEKGKLVDVWAYYNNADEVELFLNNRSLGVKRKTGDDLHVMWRVPFEPGELKAISRKNGEIVLQKKIRTAGAPARIELIADRTTIKANGKDLSFITARIVDKDGNLVPDADTKIVFGTTGAGTIAATDNGYQADLTPFSSKERKCWKGLALVIVRAAEKQGNITLKATATGLPPTTIVLKSAK